MNHFSAQRDSVLRPYRDRLGFEQAYIYQIEQTQAQQHALTEAFHVGYAFGTS